MASPTKAPITCHILDTTVGAPARNVRVRLQLTSDNTTTTSAPQPSNAAAANKHPSGLPIVFESSTDDDGRVRTWLPYSSPDTPGEVPVYSLEDVLGDIKGPSRWTLRFDTGDYFAAQGKETFFPEVTVVFEVREGQHYHVPLLLAPFSYSTYRGS
ncbi:hydroxyisourate hydrolase [Diaporthe helianthi]|uniref:hydroxyisourate hydrolase n=1 Tax=Diaporthe helianthi TaxID=158607 RepID=A0A2P5HRX5_DIAHE|nr:hydroxyisourate hydrolase [Diaporthe helianthi]